MEARPELHPLADLSAYLDGALADEPRRHVASHVSACAACRARLEELRATARLIAALPTPAPSRSLVPGVAIPFWLAPMRTLAAIASGAAALLFVASTLLANAPSARMSAGGGAPAAVSAADQRSGQAAASPSENKTRGESTRSTNQNPPTTPDDSAKLAGAPTAAPTPVPVPAPDALTARGTPTNAPETAGGAAGRTDQGAQAYDVSARDSAATRALWTSPWLWLAVAIGFGVLALALQRRLRPR